MAARSVTHPPRLANAQPVHQHPDRAGHDGTSGETIHARQRRAREQIRCARQQARWREREAIVTQRTADTHRNEHGSSAPDHRGEVA
jgi:hypothetical protein